MAKYKITGQAYFRGIKLHPIGSIVDIGEEKPAPGWIPLNDDETPKAPAKPAPAAPPKSK